MALLILFSTRLVTAGGQALCWVLGKHPSHLEKHTILSYAEARMQFCMGLAWHLTHLKPWKKVAAFPYSEGKLQKAPF